MESPTAHSSAISEQACFAGCPKQSLLLMHEKDKCSPASGCLETTSASPTSTDSSSEVVGCSRRCSSRAAFPWAAETAISLTLSLAALISFSTGEDSGEPALMETCCCSWLSLVASSWALASAFRTKSLISCAGDQLSSGFIVEYKDSMLEECGKLSLM